MLQLPATWESTLQKRIRSYAKLDAERRQRFLAYVVQFIREKQFIGESRMVVDEEMKLIIAGSAVRLVLEIGLEHLREVQRIFVYPQSFPVGEHLAAGAVYSDRSTIDVHLGWAQVVRGLDDPRDGYDVLLHEFAHVLDHDAGNFDGIPRLRPSQDYELWAHVLHRNFLDRRTDESQEPVLRSYGYTHPAELFAVATEAFFEKPHALAAALPDLYLKLKRFYGSDPGAAT